MKKLWLTKVWQGITYPYRIMHEYIQFNRALDRQDFFDQGWEARRNKSSEDVGHALDTLEKQVNEPRTGTEVFDSFSCQPEQLNDYLRIFQRQKETYGYAKMKVDSMAYIGKNFVTVIVRYYSPYL